MDSDSNNDQPINDGISVVSPSSELSGNSGQFKDFHSRYGTAMAAWHKLKGNLQFPVLQNDDGTFRWVNRKERRMLQRKYGPKMRVYAHNYK